MKAVAAAALCWVWPVIAGAADYTGSASCQPCHVREYSRQTRSHHAHALRPIHESPVAKLLINAGTSPDGKMRYEDQGDAIRITGPDVPPDTMLTWAFGAGAQGITPVGVVDGQYIEHQFSYYSRPQKFAPTFGHPARVSTPIAELGILQDKRTILKCFGCHGTGLDLRAERPVFTHLEPGVTCERCHGPGSAHMEAARAGGAVEVIRQAVVNPGRFPPAAQVEICGQCHRLPKPDTGDAPELLDPVNVRFAPVSLTASRCFRESKRLACLTCHDPHEDAKPRGEAFYTERCQQCHEPARAVRSRCPRKTNEACLSCHMKQASLGPYLRFTDHRIRVYRE